MGDSSTGQGLFSFGAGPPTIAAFITKWQKSTQSERASAQSHFRDLCDLLGQPDPSSDPGGEDYAFEKSVTKIGGGAGYADVWKRSHFAWEYKGKHKNLVDAYKQLLNYREALDNPPLLVVCDLARFEVHTNFTDTAKKVYAFSLADLLSDEPTPTCSLPPMDVLRALFEDPERLRPARTTSQVTEEAAAQFSRLAESLRARGHDAQATAQFLIRLLFCLFAEDVGLLPGKLLSRLVERTRYRPDVFARRLAVLFAAMSGGGDFGEHDIKHFNGGLFQNADVLEVTREDLATLLDAARLDWDSIEPSVFGTLFERGLDPAKRAQLGAHYTSRADILLVVEPVLMAPLRRRWRDVQAQALALMPERDGANARQQAQVSAAMLKRLQDFAAEVAAVRVLDPACGSGNFLYVALRELLDLEKEVINFAAACDLSGFFPSVGPEQMHGIELNEFAAQLAPITVNIGYIQWKRDNAFGQIEEPILRHTRTIIQQDALLTDRGGLLAEPDWPKADVIIGNPPFLGGNRIRQELGDQYVEALFGLYGGRIPAFADLVCYWFERARALVASGEIQRVGLLATNSIRGGANRKVLERIKHSGDIFLAWADRPWVLEGASVRVSMIGFDNGAETVRTLDGLPADAIHADLTGDMDLTAAQPLRENKGLCFRTDEKGGPFDIDAATAQTMLSAPLNPNGRPNSDVVRPYFNGLDVVRRPRDVWIIDFGVNISEEDASYYELPFEYTQRVVKPVRDATSNQRERDYWWLHRRPAPDMREAVASLPRFIATPAIAKHRLFSWLRSEIIPDHAVFAFARSDDYFFGVLHSRAHELWALRMGTSLEDRPRYTPTTTFETFPFPWPPGQEPTDDPKVNAIAEAARALVQKRDAWLNPAGAGAAELAQRTLTNLYNERPTWLDGLHKTLDAAVLAAYGWPPALMDEELLERLLGLNKERA
jgi:type II restriction/modification system DNA methylase subunit YeeA